MFWFAWITDTHIDTLLSPSEESRLAWAVGDAVSVVRPYFIVVTGDLTDSTDGVIYGTGPHEEEWTSYRGILDAAGMGPEYYLDLPGNHDAYGDGELVYYRRHSVLGSSDDATQHQWRLDLPFGSYHFVGVATPANDGRQWPWDNKEFTDAELAQTAEFFAANRDTDLTLVFGHHDFTGVSRGGVLEDQMIEAGAAYYFHGHEHDVGVRVGRGNILRLRISSLGQAWNDHFAVVAVDANALSYAVVSADDPWPLIVVTAPVDARLGPGNDTIDPYAPPVPTRCAEAPVRALVFDEGAVTAVRFRWDDGGWTDMARWPAEEAQWRGRFDARTLTAGLHTLTVQAVGSRTRAVEIQVDTVDGACDLGPEDPPPGPDADADADADADVVEDTAGDSADAGLEPDGVRDGPEEGEEETDGGVETAEGEEDGGGEFKSGSGCGCRVEGGPPAGAGALFLPVVAVFRRRRGVRR